MIYIQDVDQEKFEIDYTFYNLLYNLQVDELFEKFAKEKKVPVAGVIIEPIQAEGGDNHGSSSFFQKLQKIVKKVNYNIHSFRANKN